MDEHDTQPLVIKEYDRHRSREIGNISHRAHPQGRNYLNIKHVNGVIYTTGGPVKVLTVQEFANK